VPSFLRGLIEQKKAPLNPIPRAVSNSRTGLATAIPNMQIWDIDQALFQGYERVIWVYRCVDAIASNSSYMPMIMRKYNDKDGQDIEDQHLFNLLNRRPNRYETAQQFRYRMASQLLLSRRGVFIEIVKNRAGRPAELHLLPPGMTRPVPDPKEYVSGYIVQTQQQGTVELEPDQVIWIKAKPHPTDVYAQMTPLVSAGLAIDTDWLARLYNRNFLANDGRPGMLVAVQGQLMPEDAEEIRRRFSGGPTAAGQTTVIEADGISATDMSASPRDVQYMEAVRGSKEDILLAFGVPESVLGNASGRTFDNADAEAEVFWSATMQPFMDSMATGFDVLTEDGLEDDIYVAYDYSVVDVLQRQTRIKHDKALNEFQSGVLTIDEYLAFVGKEPFDVPGTRVLWIPQGNVPVGKNDDDTKAAAALMPVGMAQPANPEEESFRGATMGTEAGQHNFQNELQARALRLAGRKNLPLDQTDPQPPTSQPDQISELPETKALDVVEDATVIEFKAFRHPYEAARTAVEAEIGGVVSAWSRRQERSVIERLGGVKARKHTRHWDGEAGTKALDAVYIVNPDAWAEDLVSDMSDLLRSIGEKEAMKAARQLQRAGVLDKILEDGQGFPNERTALDKILGGRGLMRQAAIDGPASAVEEMIRDAAIRQSQKVIERIAELDAQGASLDDIKSEVKKMIGSRSSWRRGLSVAAATSIMEGARNEIYAKGGRHIQRVWRTMRDERVRPSHRRAHGQKRVGSNKFRVGGWPMQYPGDLTAPIEETANCRCWVEFHVRNPQ